MLTCKSEQISVCLNVKIGKLKYTKFLNPYIIENKSYIQRCVPYLSSLTVQICIVTMIFDAIKVVVFSFVDWFQHLFDLIIWHFLTKRCHKVTEVTHWYFTVAILIQNLYVEKDNVSELWNIIFIFIFKLSVLCFDVSMYIVGMHICWHFNSWFWHT